MKLDAKEEFDFEINSGSINATGTEITFNLTKSRTLTLKNNNGQVVDNLNNADINNLLALTFSNANLYFENNDSPNTSSFSIPSGITLNNDILKVDVSTGQGKLVESSAQNHNAENEGDSDIVINGEGEGFITGKDQFLFPLTISEGYTFTNNIKNPGLRAVVYPRDAFDAYIGLELYETTLPNASRITELNTSYAEGEEGTLRHGKTADGYPLLDLHKKLILLLVVSKFQL